VQGTLVESRMFDNKSELFLRQECYVRTAIHDVRSYDINLQVASSYDISPQTQKERQKRIILCDKIIYHFWFYFFVGADQFSDE